MARRAPRPLLAVLGVLAPFALTTAAVGSVHADDLRAHATAGLAHAVGTPQSRELGFGAAGSASLELPLGDRIGVEGKLSGLVLAEGDPPADPSLAPRGTGTVLFATAGLRVRPFTAVAGPWASAALGYAQTGSRARLGLDAMLGWDARVSRDGRWDVGPYVGYQHVLQPDDALRPEDARIVSIGIHVGLGVPRAKPPSDRDGDAVLDPEDACPDTPGVRTGDPRTHGCPPPEPPKPPARPDRDEDAVFDDEDACPDLRGIRTADPRTNGCPRADRDKDTVFDDEDACPDVPGVRTTDPRTSGCPEAHGDIRVENERIVLDEVILFDTDSPRVRHASWAIVERLAKFISANPGILEVSIEGHADATGTEAHNLVLSRERAESVKKLLVRYGVDPARLKAEAHGRSRPRVPTTRAEAKNRRVEFWVTRTPSTTEATPAPGKTGGK